MKFIDKREILVFSFRLKKFQIEHPETIERLDAITCGQNGPHICNQAMQELNKTIGTEGTQELIIQYSSILKPHRFQNI